MRLVWIRFYLNIVKISIGLAIAHLILEGGILYLDKSAFRLDLWNIHYIHCIITML